MIKHTLTGKYRHRVCTRLFSAPILVLQLEVHRTGWEVLDAIGTSFDRDDYYWKDASVEDISVWEVKTAHPKEQP